MEEETTHTGHPVRLDVLLYERGLAESREKAKRLILAGQVRVAGRLVDKAGATVAADVDLDVREGPKYVSRGGQKLAGALDAFGIDPSGSVAADVGASTGGFTDCLLQRGAARVYAIDVGYGQLHWKLRQDPRVIVMERTNARYLEALPEAVQLVTADVSFISLRLVLPRAQGWLSSEGQCVALIKPQFEAVRRQVGRGGVVRDPRVHRAVLTDLLTWAAGEGWRLHGLVRSCLKGPKGNSEFLVWWSQSERWPVLGVDGSINALVPTEHPVGG